MSNEKRKGHHCIPHSQITKDLIRSKILGKKHGPPSEETRKKISLENTGKKRTKEQNEVLRDKLASRPEEIKQEVYSRIRNTLLGTKHTPEAREKIRLANLRRNPEVYERIRAKTKGQKRTVEQKQRMYEGLKKALVDGKPVRYGNTSIERALKQELESRNIRFIHQARICGFLVDFLLPDFSIVIEADGCYWHFCPLCKHKNLLLQKQETIDKDQNRDNQLIISGYVVLPKMKHDIKRSPKDCIDQLGIN